MKCNQSRAGFELVSLCPANRLVLWLMSYAGYWAPSLVFKWHLERYTSELCVVGVLPRPPWWTFLTVTSTERFHCQINLVLHLSRCRVALRPAVLSAAWIWPSVSQYLDISFGLRGPSLQAFTPFGRGSSPGAWDTYNKGNANGAVGIFGNAGRVWATALRSDPPKKALCHTCQLGGAVIKYCRSISVLSKQYETSYLFYVILSFLCNII